MRIADFEVRELGIDSPDYFQGFGTSFTRFDHAVVGIGSTTLEALDDAIEQAATSADVDDVSALEGVAAFDGITIDNQDVLTDDEQESGMYVYVGILYNLEK
jgi:hypothetical protein